MVRNSLAMIVDSIRDEAECGAGALLYEVDAFDLLAWQQRLAVLADVGDALLRDDVPMMGLWAWNEGAVAAIFENVRQSIEFEMSSELFEVSRDGEPKVWRELLLDAASLKAAREPVLRPGQPVPSKYEQVDYWNYAVGLVEGEILWDADYEDAANFLDASPDHRRTMDVILGVGEDYFTAVPPDPTEAELPAIWRRLKTLTAGT